MKLLTAVEIDRLIKNGETCRDSAEGIDHPRVAKLFTPDASCTWLLSEIDPDNTDVAFGLCDLGFGCPELGSVSLSEIAGVRGKLGLPVERDLYFTATYPLTVYAEAARAAGGITEDAQVPRRGRCRDSSESGRLMPPLLLSSPKRVFRRIIPPPTSSPPTCPSAASGGYFHVKQRAA